MQIAVLCAVGAVGGDGDHDVSELVGPVNVRADRGEAGDRLLCGVAVIIPPPAGDDRRRRGEQIQPCLA